MENTQLEHFKKLFNEIILNATADEEALLEALNSREGGDEVDQSLEERERQLILKLKGRRQFFLKKVEKALLKIDNGTFGECEECGCDIELNRLYARPTATMCIGCKEEQEGVENGISYQKRSHTLGRTIVNDTNQALVAEKRNTPKLRIVQENFTI